MSTTWIESHESKLLDLLDRRHHRGRQPMYRNLLAWRKAMVLVTAVYDVTRNFPKDEIYGLTSQVRRASVSVASNITESQGRRTMGEITQFFSNARGSLLEVEAQLMIAATQGYVSQDVFDVLLDLTEEIFRLINGLLKKSAESVHRQ